MKAETLFNAYRRATRKKELYFRNRQKDIVFGDALRGIAVNKDRWARKWQKADRQARKFEAALRRKLQELEQQRCKPKELHWVPIADKNLEFIAETPFGTYNAFAWDCMPGWELEIKCSKSRGVIVAGEDISGEWDSIDDAIDAAMAAAQADFDKRWRSITEYGDTDDEA